ncbi:MAG: 7-carboxy-7-deazaguanine synthase QueE [Flavobacteriia bacterium]|nr:7-carboxy-7-deazaguanine synthase QueE [Flavobacteriia bacterium]
MEHFYTLQGEGFHSGRAAYFIRLAGCDVGCVWCDVKESWEEKGFPKKTAYELFEIVKQTKAQFVVLTGGEPALHDLSPLISLFQQQKIQVAIETSGCYSFSDDLDWVCLSPKKFKNPLVESFVKANELKIVVYHKSDFQWAEEQEKLVNNHCILYLQPEWSKMEQILPDLIEYVKKNPKWKISLQTHKFMNIP